MKKILFLASSLFLILVIYSAFDNSDNYLTGEASVNDPVDQRLQEAYNKLHAAGSAQQVRDNFPDIELVFTDTGEPHYPREILPFEYYYSKEADKTFNLCAIERTVFICDGKLNRKITSEDEDSGRCIITPIYQITSDR
jgi:hypothetical protein